MKKFNSPDLKIFKPRTPSLRHTVLFKNPEISREKPLKHITKGKKQKAGRSHGRISIWHRGGGHKRKYRLVDFKRNENAQLLVCGLEYDPNRTASIARVQNLQSGKFYYILASLGMRKGQVIDNTVKSTSLNVAQGTTYRLSDLVVGTKVYNIEMKPGKGGQLIRSAGAVGYILSKDKQSETVKVKLPSGNTKELPENCKACVGQVSNDGWMNRSLGKAGRSRWYSRRPTVRGVAMNPVDHPHGGGEGKTSGGRPSVTPWGHITKGVPTRKK